MPGQSSSTRGAWWFGVGIALTLAGLGCSKKKPRVLAGPGTVQVQEAQLSLQLPAGTSVEWMAPPSSQPTSKTPQGNVVIHLPSGFTTSLMVGRPSLIADEKAAFTRNVDFAKKYPKAGGIYTGEVLVDAPDAFVPQRRYSDDANRTWCATTACKQVGARHLCVQTTTEEADSPVVDAHTGAVTTRRVRITDGDCKALVEIVRSLAPLP